MAARGNIFHARGLRQGDPLLPILFVIVMEVLNALISEADRWPIFAPLPNKTKYCTSVYADNIVIFLHARLRQHSSHPRPLRGRLRTGDQRQQVHYHTYSLLQGTR